jgi:hypothetical protein
MRLSLILFATAALAGLGCGSSGTMCPAQTGAGTSHQGTVDADETWTEATGPHRIEANLFVSAGIVTIEPCVTVLVSPGVNVTLGGGNTDSPDAGLVARGTAQRPIRFSPAVPGVHWGMLRIFRSANVDLESVILLEGGDHATAQNLGGTLVMQGIGGTTPMRNTRVKDVRIEGSAGFGINVQSAGGFTTDSSGLVIVGGGEVPGPSADTSYPIYVTPPSLQTLPPGNYAGNAKDQILVAPGITQDADETFHDLGIPYRIQDGFQMAPMQTVADGGLVTVTIEAGVKILLLKTSTNTWAFRLGSSNGGGSSNIWPARLVAAGTDAKPIVFTSASETPAAGDWAGILWSGGPATGNVMSYVRVEYAGGDIGTGNFGCGPPENEAAIVITNWRPSSSFMDHVTVSDSAGGGIVSGWSTDENGPDLKTGNTFTRIGNGCDVSRWSNVTPPACPDPGPPICL